MHNTLDDKSLQAKREAARLRKQKSRQQQKAHGKLVRFQPRIGTGDRQVLLLIAQHFGVTVSDLVTFLVREHTTVDGQLHFDEEAGGVWETPECQLELHVSPEVRDRLEHSRYRLTPGEAIEIMLGLILNPSWDLDEECLIGSYTASDGTLVVPPTKMSAPGLTHWRRGEARWQQAVAKGLNPDDVWPDRLPALQRALRAADADMERAAKTGDLSVTRNEVKIYGRDFGAILLAWDNEPDLDALVAEIARAA